MHIGVAAMYPGRLNPSLVNQLGRQVSPGFACVAYTAFGRKAEAVAETIHEQNVPG